MAVCQPCCPTRYRVTQQMHTSKLKSKTLSQVSQGAYVRVGSKRRRPGMTMLSPALPKRFRVPLFAQSLPPVNAITRLRVVTKLTPSIQIP